MNTGGPASEKARREADHSGDANKMAVECGKIEFIPNFSPDSGKMAELENVKKDLAQALDEGVWLQAAADGLRRLAADVLPADIRDAANDEPLGWCAEQVRAHVNTLTERNRELVEALDLLMSDDATEGCDEYRKENARAILAKHKGAA